MAFPDKLKLFLSGDVMTGRAIDQVLPFSVSPELYEPYVNDAGDYVKMAEHKNGPIPKPVNYTYIWGDAMQVWQQLSPDLKLINLETSITCNPTPWPGKEVCYRMHSANTEVLAAVGINCCILANNHTLDWGRPGLLDTLLALRKAHIPFAGAGNNLQEASQPTILKSRKGNVIVLAYGAVNSGVPQEWAATKDLSGINLLPDFSSQTIKLIAEQVRQLKTRGSVVIFSVHWGSNWGYEVPPLHQDFAHQLIDNAGIDIVFGHSSHHPRGIEVYNNKLILYGAGDFINDYEGISGHEQFRSDLTLMYFPEIELETGRLISLLMVPMQIRNFRLNYTSPDDADWLTESINQQSIAFGTMISVEQDHLILKI